ncbi:MAG TPA: hypothetical protein VK747_23600 [Blastocatellia bacterium]|nr:hypothetical protein [Blastocatellia bacterium]
MRTCPVCGLDVEDSYLFCPEDGSSLVEPQITDRSSASDATSEAQAAGAADGLKSEGVVLYCGECAAEYPMTFVACPVHSAPLTWRKIQPVAARSENTWAPASTDPHAQQPDSSEQPDKMCGSSGALSVAPSDPSDLLEATAAEAVAEREEAREPLSMGSVATLADFRSERKASTRSLSILAVDEAAADYIYKISSERAPEPFNRFDSPSFRIVAAAMVVALVLFCVVAVYTFFSGGAQRRLAARKSQPAPAAVAEQPPFIPTPDSARDYEEEQSHGSAPNEQRPDADNAPPGHTSLPPSIARAEKARPDTGNTKPAWTTSDRPTPVSTGRAANAAPSPAMTTASTTREVTSPRSEVGLVDSRLVRVRSMRTGAGVRYDLTFDLQDESGRHAQWERMLISTRSASGVTHSDTVPFVHRLGAHGALTFTVSVEMRGHSEPDWRGKIVCTTLGSDDGGKTVRASFGANVTP